MAYQVTLNNIVFTLPDPGDPPVYAEELKAYFQELAKVGNNQLGPLDIVETDFNFANNQSSPANVQGFDVVTANKASFVADYLVTRTDGSIILTESGQIFGMQGSAGWSIAIGNIQSDSTLFDGFSGVSFDITSGGQLTYTSTNLVGQSQGIITFKLKSLVQG